MNDEDYEFLSKHSSNSMSRDHSQLRTPSLEAKSIGRKSNISAKTDLSRITRFLYPKEHLSTLRQQKSPLRRSNSAKHMRKMVQGHDPSFYATPKRGPIALNLINFNQKLLEQDKRKAKRSKVQPGIIGT